MMKKTTSFLLLCIFPMIFLFIGLSFSRAKYSNDPEYIYLINALNLAKFQSVGHFDNPGTTVMELGLGVVFFTHLFDSTASDGLVEEVLKNPDKYVEAFSTVLIVLICLVLLYVGYLVFKKTNRIWAALLIQITPFLSANVLEHAWTKTSPEPMLLITSILLSGVLVLYYYDLKKGEKPYYLLFAIISGFGLATKATYLPLAIIPFLLLPGLRNKARYIGLLILTFLLFTIPAWPLFPSMLNWFYNLLTHKGIYGKGERGIIDLPVYFTSLKAIFRNNPAFSFTVVSSILLLALFKTIPKLRVHTHTLQYRILFALILSYVFAILIVAKHYQHNHYLLPELATIGVALYFLVKNLTLVVAKQAANSAFSVLATISVIFVLVVIAPHLASSNQGYKITNQEFEKTSLSINEKYADYKEVYFFPTSLNKYSALMFGNAYSQQKNLAEMQALYPDVLFLNKMTRSFEQWGTKLTFDEMTARFGAKLLLTGGPLTEPEADEIRGWGIPLTTIYQGRTQAVYMIDNNNISLEQAFSGSITLPKIMSCDMETLNFDRQYVVSGDQKFFAGTSHSSEKARSGKYSVKLAGQQIYALEHILQDAMPGDQFKISIWRYSDNNEGFLVAASTPEQIFYHQVGESGGIDTKGWRLVTSYFTIPQNIGANQVKIYVWNSGSGTMYFDDLTVERL